MFAAASSGRNRFVAGLSLPAPRRRVTTINGLVPLSLERDHLSELVEKPIYQALPSLYAYWTQIHLSMTHALAQLAQMIGMDYRDSELGRIMFRLMDRFIVVTRALSYLLDEVGELAKLARDILKSGGEGGVSEYFSFRTTHSELWGLLREDVWAWIELVTNSEPLFMYALAEETAQRPKLPPLDNLKHASSLLPLFHRTSVHVWLSETPNLYATILSSTVSIHRTYSGWESLLESKAGTTIRSETASLIRVLGSSGRDSAGFLTRDEEAEAIRALWTPYSWESKDTKVELDEE